MKNIYKFILKNHVKFFKTQKGFIVNSNEVIYQSNNICIVLKPCLFRFNTPQQLSFWFDISVFLILSLKVSSKQKISFKNLVENNHLLFTKRWGFLSNQPYSQYTITNSTNDQEINKEIRNFSEIFFIPFCVSIKNFEDLIINLNEKQLKTNSKSFNFCIAIGLALLNEKERSKAYFVDSEGEKGIILQIAEQYGVKIN